MADQTDKDQPPPATSAVATNQTETTTAITTNIPPPPAAPTVEPVPTANGQRGAVPSLEESSKKKSRLQWDEDNLTSNALEMERAGPRMKIDEPKTPFVQGSETGSSTSGSAHQSPPESPSFIPGERLVGFHSLEASMRGSGGTSSDGASSAGSAGRSVHIIDDIAHSSGGSSPRSKELFKAKRKAHYRNEAARFGKSVLMAAQLDQDKDDDDDDNDTDADDEGHDNELPNGHQNGTQHMNGGIVGAGQSVRARVAMLNKEPDNTDAPDDGGGDDG